MWIFLCILACGGIAIIIRKLIQGRRRRLLLLAGGKVCTWSDIISEPKQLKIIVETNFGFGKELWGIKSEASGLDLKPLSFKNGVLIVLRPHSTEVKEFCRAQGIKYERRITK